MTLGDQVRVYDALAPVYDTWTAHPDYRGWVERLLGLALAARPAVSRALDVGCGTGRSTEVLAARLAAVTACDPSAGMLAQARRRLGPGVTLLQAGLPQLDVPGAYDCISCLNDVVNYVAAGAPLASAMRALAGRLARGGVLVFDSSTVAMYRELFAVSEHRERGGLTFRWSGTSARDFRAGATATAVLRVERAGGGVVLEHRHVQHHHPEGELRRTLEAAGLRILGVWGHRDDGVLRRPVDPERHTKLVWLVQRP